MAGESAHVQHFPDLLERGMPIFLEQLMDPAFHKLYFRKCCQSREQKSNLFLADNSKAV